MEVLLVFMVLEHGRRPCISVTGHATVARTVQQIVEAFTDRDPARYMIRVRDSIYGHDVGPRIASPGMQDAITAPRVPNRPHPTTVPEPFRGPDCQTPEENIDQVLPRIAARSRTRQTVSFFRCRYRARRGSSRSHSLEASIIVMSYL